MINKIIYCKLKDEKLFLYIFNCITENSQKHSVKKSSSYLLLAELSEIRMRVFVNTEGDTKF
jgi:hypothetical protein